MTTLLLLFLLNNFYSSVTCYTKCKEYILIWKEINCPESKSSVIEPIKLDEIEWNYKNNTEDSSKILSYEENYSNKTYLLNIDFTGLEAVCIPIIKSSKLHIEVELENITTHESNELDKEGPDKNITAIDYYSIKRSLLDCLIKNYTKTCDKPELNKTIDINLVYVNKTATNVKELLHNETEASIVFEQCFLTENNFCKNSDTIDDTESNYNISQSIFLTISNKDTNKTEYVNCTNIISNRSSIDLRPFKELIYNIINKYACKNKLITALNVSKTLPTFNMKVYLATPDLSVLNAKVQQINCSENNLPRDNSTSSIDCYIKEVVEVHMKEKYVAATIGSSTAHAPTSEPTTAVKTPTEAPTTKVRITESMTTKTPSTAIHIIEVKTTQIITTEPRTKILSTETTTPTTTEITTPTTTETTTMKDTTTEMPTTIVTNSTSHKPIIVENNTTKSNIYNYTKNTTDPQQEMYYISPRVFILAVMAILAVVGCVSLYAFCLFRPRKREYEVAPRRDWSTMPESQF